MYIYKGYEIEKITRYDYVIYTGDGIQIDLLGTFGRFPKTLKEAREYIDIIAE